MARALTSGFISAITAANCAPFYVFEGEFSASTLRLWNGLGDLSWNSQTWLGNGWLQAIEGGEESIEVEVNDLTVVLSGVPASAMSLVLGSQKQGGLGKVWIGMMDSDGAIIADPYLRWQGYYSHADIEHAPEETLLRLYYDSPLVGIDRPNEGRWTHDAQQRLFDGDKGFEYVIAAANWNWTWGQKKEKQDKKQVRPGVDRKGSPRKR